MKFSQASKRNIILIAILTAVIGMPALKYFYSKKSLKVVETTQFSEQRINASILASGKLKHEHQVKLSAEVIGKVTKLHAEEGDHISQGQLLLEIDDKTYMAEVRQQEAVVEQNRAAIEKQNLIVKNLESQRERKSSLFNKKMYPLEDYEEIAYLHNVSKLTLKENREQLKQAIARLEQTKNLLLKTKVQSPIDGVITSLEIKVGETAISGTTNIAGSSFMTIADPQSMIAEINVDEADIGNLEVGHRAEIVAIAYNNSPITGTVKSIASSARVAEGKQSLTIAVKLKIDNINDLNLLPGMSCRAEVFTHGDQYVYAVPISAIKTQESKERNLTENYVFVIENGIAKKKLVKTGLSDDRFQHIISGLKKGEIIITGPDRILRHLKDGDKVVTGDNS